MSIRIEQYDGGEVLYVAVDPDGIWAKSDFPDEVVTIDYNAQGGIIGIEVIGSLAHAGADAVLKALLDAERVDDRRALRKTLEPLIAA